MADVFLSYSRQDSAIAERVERKLSESGISVWRDKSRLAPGDQWTTLIGEEVFASRLMLLLWSKNANESGYVKFEWGTALAQNKPILPFCLDNTGPAHSLSGFHHVPYESGQATAAVVAAALGREEPRPAVRKRTWPRVLAAGMLAALLAAALLFLRRPAPVASPSQTVQLQLNAGAIDAKLQIDQQTKVDIISSLFPTISLTQGDHNISIIRDKEATCTRKVSIHSQTKTVPLDCF
jgi:TIR domain-containing protein